MKHFVSVILSSEITEEIYESVKPQTNRLLTESVDEFIIGEDVFGNNVLRLPLETDISDNQADFMVNEIADRLFEMGYDDFEIEVSGKGGVDFDIVDDCLVFMRNDSSFYRRHLYPAILKMKGKQYSPEKALGHVVDDAIDTYCKKFNLGSPKNVFSSEDRKELLSKLHSEESMNVSKGVYD